MSIGDKKSRYRIVTHWNKFKRKLLKISILNCILEVYDNLQSQNIIYDYSGRDSNVSEASADYSLLVACFTGGITAICILVIGVTLTLYRRRDQQRRQSSNSQGTKAQVQLVHYDNNGGASATLMHPQQHQQFQQQQQQQRHQPNDTHPVVTVPSLRVPMGYEEQKRQLLLQLQQHTVSFLCIMNIKSCFYLLC